MPAPAAVVTIPLVSVIVNTCAGLVVNDAAPSAWETYNVVPPTTAPRLSTALCGITTLPTAPEPDCVTVLPYLACTLPDNVNMRSLTAGTPSSKNAGTTLTTSNLDTTLPSPSAKNITPLPPRVPVKFLAVLRSALE